MSPWKFQVYAAGLFRRLGHIADAQDVGIYDRGGERTTDTSEPVVAMADCPCCGEPLVVGLACEGGVLVAKTRVQPIWKCGQPITA